jgi:hypothetical protein
MTNMAEYVLVYHGSSMPETEKEGAALMAVWRGWMESLGSVLTDPGNPVGNSKTVQSDGSVTSGGGTNPLSGYSVLEADSLDAAAVLAKGCPERRRISRAYRIHRHVTARGFGPGLETVDAATAGRAGCLMSYSWTRPHTPLQSV